METPEQKTLNLIHLAKKIDPTCCDLILVEGFKHEKIPKIAIYRHAVAKPFDELIDQYVIAVASDFPINSSITILDINTPTKIVAFIINWANQLIHN